MFPKMKNSTSMKYKHKAKNVEKLMSKRMHENKFHFSKRSHTFGVPSTQSRMWSHAALAADKALDSFLAFIIAAPLCCTVVMNSVFNLEGDVH